MGGVAPVAEDPRCRIANREAQGFHEKDLRTTGIVLVRFQTFPQSPYRPMALPNDPDEEMRDRIGGNW